MRRTLALMHLLAVLGLPGCGEPAVLAPAPAASAAPVRDADSILAGSLRISAIGEREGELLHVHRLEVYRAGQRGPVQVIHGLQTDTPWPPGRPGLEAPDMNFDGHPDLRLIEFRAAGPNTPWRHWLYDPAQQRFVASEALDALSPTRFDAASRRIIVDWRDGAARHGSDAYVWRDGALQPAPAAP